MIEIKCTNEKCSYEVSRGANAKDMKRTRNCPLCKARLKRNLTDPIARKKWHCFLSRDGSIVEHSVLVVMDSYSDNSYEIEIPFLRKKFSERDMLQGFYKAFDEIRKYLETQYKAIYQNQQQFVTTAFQHETEPARRNIPIKEMIFIDSGLPENEAHDGSASDSPGPKIKHRKGISKAGQSRLF
jgi:hypothetical protein